MKRSPTAHTDIGRYCAWDAMRRAVPSAQAVAIYADEFGLSPSLVEKMRLPHGGRCDTGRKSLSARLYDAIFRCWSEAGVQLPDAVQVLAQPASRLGYRLAGARRETAPTSLDLVLPALNRSTGELAAYLVECLADGELDALERRGLRERLHAALDAYVGVEVLAEVYAR